MAKLEFELKRCESRNPLHQTDLQCAVDTHGLKIIQTCQKKIYPPMRQSLLLVFSFDPSEKNLLLSFDSSPVWFLSTVFKALL